MNTTVRATRACSVEDLHPKLRDAMRAHAAHYQLGDLESNLLMCCETTSIHQRRGMFGGADTTISAVFVTPKWLIWADDTDPNQAGAGSALLRQIDVHDYETTTMYASAPDLGLNVSGHYTDVNKTGMTFIALGSGPDGQRFRQVLEKAMEQTKGG
jgi:hypothetical protein